MTYHRGEMEGFWYTRNRKVYKLDIEDIHIKYLFEHFEDFGIRFSEIEEICQNIGVEANADLLAEYFDELSGSEQDQFFQLAYEHGNIRIRIYDCIDAAHISIEFYSTKKNDSIISCLIDFEDFFNSTYLPIQIFDYHTGQNERFYSVNQALNFYLED